MEVDHVKDRSVEAKVREHGFGPLLGDGVHYEKFYGRDGQIYVLILMPLKAAAGASIGYLGGFYKVAADAMAEIRECLNLSLLQVVVIVFLTALVVYPLVLS